MRNYAWLVIGALGLAGCGRAEHQGPGVGVTDGGLGGGLGVMDGGHPEVDEADASPPATNECPATQLAAESDIAAIRTLTSDATHLYYVLWPCDLDECPPGPHEVRAVAKAGGIPTILALEPGYISEHIAVAGGHVYWIRSVDRAIMRVSIDGQGQPEVVYQSAAPTGYLAANADGVYWRTLDENERWTRLERLPLAGGGVETVGSLPPDAGFSLLDDARVYYLTGSSSATALLHAMDLATGETHTLTTGPESFAGGEFTQDALALEWSGAGGLRRLAKSGGEPVTIVEAGGYDVGSNGELALYYGFDDEGLHAAPVTGGAPTLIAPATCNLFGTWLERVIDSDRVYWSSGHDIFAVSLPHHDSPAGPQVTLVPH
jgi:hypothetical protein